jgi:integrase
MALYKRKSTWWTDFSVNGQRFRESLDTSDWREAQAKQKELISNAAQGKLAPSSQQFSRLAFSVAAERYLESRKLELSPKSLQKETQLLVQPGLFLGTTPLHKINAEQLQSYREQRAAQGTSPSFINMEMGALRRILKRAKRWHLIGEDLRPLKERRRVGRALSEEEKAKLIDIASANPDWQVARCAAILALNTTMRGCELKNLLWKDVDLVDRTLTIRRSKTEAGERVIPLNSEAMETILELLRRAETFDGANLDKFVFPACENGKIDPTRPQQTWRTAWRRLTRTIRCATCGQLQDPGKICCSEDCKADISKVKSSTEGLRFHDLRHHAITELAESNASDQTIMAIAEHVSQKMLAHYSHVRLEAKRKALDALAIEGKGEGYGTNNDTKPVPAVAPNPQVIEMNGRPVGTRTPDLYRVKVAL